MQKKIIPTLNHRIHRIIDFLMQKKINQNATLSSKSDFFCKDIPTNTHNHRAYIKKIKTEIDRKKITPGVSCDTIQG
jgi:hypothetical protein